MTIPVECPDCTEPLNIPEKYAGKTVKCPHCSGMVRVPLDEPDEPDERDEPDEDEDIDRPRRRSRPPKRRAKPKSSNGVLIGVVVGLAVLVGVAVGAALLVRSGKKDEVPNATQKAEDGKGLPAQLAGAPLPQALVVPARPPLPAGWVEFRHPKGEYSVYMPRPPRRLPRSREEPAELNQEAYTTQAAANRSETSCTVVAVTYPPQLMDLYRTGNIDMSVASQFFPGMKVTSNRIQWNGRVAIEATHESDLAGMAAAFPGGAAVAADMKKNETRPGNMPLKQTMYARYVVLNDRLYTFILQNFQGPPTEAERRAFFESAVFGP